MEKKILFLLPIILLSSCNQGNSNATSNSQPSTNVPSVISTTPSQTMPSVTPSTTPPSISTIPVDEQLQTFYAKLLTLEGNVKKMEMSGVRTQYYLSDNASSPFAMPMYNKSTTTRYNSEDGPILVSTGRQSYELDDNGNFSEFTYFTRQTFYDSKFFYLLTKWDDSSTGTRVVFSEDTIQDNLNIGFPLTEKANINKMCSYVGDTKYGITFQGLNNFTTNGEWNYSYSFTIYENKMAIVKVSEVTYNNTLTIKDGVITKVVQEYEDAMFTGNNLKTNWVKSKMTYTFTQGEYEDFTGERFNPNDFTY